MLSPLHNRGFVAPKTVEVRLNDGGTRVLAGDRGFHDRRIDDLPAGVTLADETDKARVSGLVERSRSFHRCTILLQ
jgi:hypothetical protein